MTETILIEDIEGGKLTARPQDSVVEISVEGPEEKKTQQIGLSRPHAVRLAAFLVSWLDSTGDRKH